MKNRSLKDQLEEAKVTAANMVSEYQFSAEMAALKQTIHDKAYEEAAEAFVYTTTTRHLNWDLAYHGANLAYQIVEWRAELQANQPHAEECPARPPSPVAEPLAVPPPHPSEVLLEQLIESN